MKIGIDAAHGGSAYGGRAFGRAAKDDNLRLALAVAEALTRNGVDTVMARQDDSGISDQSRTSVYNESGVDMVVSIDRNADTVEKTGLALWISSKLTPWDIYKIRLLGAALASVTPDSYMGICRGYPGNPAGNYRINKRTKAASVLVKALHIASKSDNAIFDTKLAEYAEAICRGVCEAFCVRYSPPPVVEESKKAKSKKPPDETDNNTKAES